ncbi:glycosyltransferase [Salinimicrobium xinjiangense]|uniref:glycosyltransferase n=1 Tax=Salinimicrobium xinjiangense TaxID=438596 RepID=UPI00068641BC|nr:glycosyltransferase [Salinimicrobium xinjiangense]
MKILHLIQKPQNRGAEIFTCQLSTHLISSCHEVKIVTLFEGEAILPFDGEIISLKASSKNRFFDIPAWKKLACIVKDFNPDIIQANAGDTLKYAVFSKKIFGWKTPLISRNASEVGRYLTSPLQKRLNSLFYKNVDFVISVSRASKIDILNHFPFLHGKTKVIPIGLEAVSAIKEINYKPEKSLHIVHVGGFTFEKNHPGLLRIFRKILNLNTNIHLHLVGDGPLRRKIEIGEEEKNLDNITFHGFVNNPLSYIKSADVLILPSIIEGLPGVLLEAMYCKTPVVAYNVGGISEIITEQTGILVPAGDEEAFATAIMKILEGNNDEKIEQAYNMVRKSFMNETIAKKFIEAYEKVLEDRAPMGSKKAVCKD